MTMPIQRTRALIGHAFYLALLFIGWTYGTAKAESLVYTDTVPFTAHGLGGEYDIANSTQH